MPRVVIAAPSSGAGKTSITTGLLAALRARGLRVSPHKVGPDYIDPGYHGLAAGRIGRNLDPWLVGQERIVPLFLHGALTPEPADIAVVEGVMGLFDGVANEHEPAGFASTAEVAVLLGAPVILVVDAAAAGRSVAAMVHGFATFDARVRIGGVIANRVGSDRHAEIVTEALAGLDIPLLGVIRRQQSLITPSRHLGLIPAAERSTEARRTVDELGALVARDVDLDAVLALARTAPAIHDHPWSAADALNSHSRALSLSKGNGSGDRGSVEGNSPSTSSGHGTWGSGHGTWGSGRGEVGSGGGRPVIAVAGGPAFTFGYAETTELLTAAGAEVVVFDPLSDETLPTDSAGLVIGGGFPEVHAEQLAANAGLRGAIGVLARSGRPVAAECAGLLYLTDTLDDAPMTGVLAARSAMTPRLTIGYRQATAASDSLLGPAGTVVRGHEFHRTATDPGAGATPAWCWRDAAGVDVVEGFAGPSLHASYLHLHWAGRPEFAGRIVAAARASVLVRA